MATPNVPQADTCPEMVYRGDTWNPLLVPCGKRVKRDGLCGTHANTKDRAKAQRQKWEEEAAAVTAARRIAERLNALGVDVTAQGGYLRITPDQAARIADRLARDAG